MVRVLHQEHALSDVFVSFLLTRNARSRRTWWISFSILVKSGWRGFCCCSPSSARKASPRRWCQRSARKSWPEMIGTTRSRVSFFMNRFRKLGFIEYNGKIRVHTPSSIFFCRNKGARSFCGFRRQANRLYYKPAGSTV